MEATSGPGRPSTPAQLRETARLVAEAVRGPGADCDLVWQSRSGPPQVPWLEPDVNDHLAALAASGTTAVVVSPIGFVSDHLEVLWDLDDEAAATAAKLGLGFARAGTAGTDPRFVPMVRELVEERTVGAPSWPSARWAPATTSARWTAARPRAAGSDRAVHCGRPRWTGSQRCREGTAL